MVIWTMRLDALNQYSDAKAVLQKNEVYVRLEYHSTAIVSISCGPPLSN